MRSICYETELVTVTICCFIAAQEKRLDLYRSDLRNPLKINFSAVFELNKIDELKTARNGQCRESHNQQAKVLKLVSSLNVCLSEDPFGTAIY